MRACVASGGTIRAVGTATADPRSGSAQRPHPGCERERLAGARYERVPATAIRIEEVRKLRIRAAR